MANDELSLDEVSELLGKKQPRRTQEEKAGSNPFEEHKKDISWSLEVGQSPIILDGRAYKVKDMGELFRINPVEGFVPMGYFPKKWLDEE